MEPQDPILYPAKRQLEKVAMTWEYGSEHTHEEIAGILGVKVGESTYYQSVSWVATQLLEVNKYLEVMVGKGYRVVLPNEFVRTSNDRVKKSKRHARMALEISKGAPRPLLNPDEKKRTDEHTLRLSRMVSMMDADAKPLFELEKQMAKRQLRTDNPKPLLTE